MNALAAWDEPAGDISLAFSRYLCRACGLIYDEAQGDPDSGLPPGTRFEDIPDDWSCPLCGVTKADFEPFEEQAPGEHGAAATHTVFSPRGHAGLVIVGAGAAGWQMARAVRELDAAMPITLVTNCSGDVYDKPLLSVALAKAISASELVKETGRHAAEKLNIRLMAETHAISVCAASNALRTTRGTLKYRHLVLAYGAAPRADATLPAHLCWAINDLRCYARFRAALARAGSPQRIVVCGAGLVGSELANDLALAGHSLVLIDIADRPLANLLEASASQDLLDAWSPLAIEFVGGTRVKRVSQGASAISVETDRGQTFEADHVLAATGLQTPHRLARSASLAWNNGIAVRADDLRTSVDNIHALGDCISIHGQALRYIEPIGRQAKVIAARLTACTPLTYAHAPPVVRVKTGSRGFTVRHRG